MPSFMLLLESAIKNTTFRTYCFFHHFWNLPEKVLLLETAIIYVNFKTYYYFHYFWEMIFLCYFFHWFLTIANLLLHNNLQHFQRLNFQPHQSIITK